MSARSNVVVAIGLVPCVGWLPRIAQTGNSVKSTSALNCHRLDELSKEAVAIKKQSLDQLFIQSSQYVQHLVFTLNPNGRFCQVNMLLCAMVKLAGETNIYTETYHLNSDAI